MPEKLTLPAGHPEAGYHDPDLTLVDPEPDGEAAKEHDKAKLEYEKSKQAVIDHEHEVAQKEQAEALGAEEKTDKSETTSSSKSKS